MHGAIIVAMVEILSVSAEQSMDVWLVSNACDLINRAYEIAEVGLWRPGLFRTTVDDTAQAIVDGEMVFALLGSQLVGAVRTRLMGEGRSWFGALSVDPALGGRGIGGKLVSFVEQSAATAGCVIVQLEVLVPQAPHPHINRLAVWYENLGYHEISRSDLAAAEPSLAPYMTGPCDLAVRHKRIEPSLPPTGETQGRL